MRVHRCTTSVAVPVAVEVDASGGTGISGAAGTYRVGHRTDDGRRQMPVGDVAHRRDGKGTGQGLHRQDSYTSPQTARAFTGATIAVMDESTGGRTARAGDYDDIVQAVDNWWGRPVSASLPRLFLDHFWSTSQVIEDEQGLAAFLVAFVSPSQPHLAYLHFVGVRPDRRRRGLAQGLYEQFAPYALDQGCTELRAITAPANDASIRFHQSLGFTVSSSAENYNGPGRPMITFLRDLIHTAKQPAG